MDKIPTLESLPIELDLSQAFLLFCANSGDIEKTAHSLGVPPVTLLRVADQENWLGRIAPIMERIKSSRPGDIERGCNAALNFVQSHRFRLVIERALKLMTGWDDATMLQNLLPESVSKEGKLSKKVSTRWCCDFAAAMEKCHSMSYMALQDSASERVKRKETQADSGSVLELHSRIAAAMQGAGDSKTPRALLFSAQLEQAESIKAQAVVPKPALDDTYTPDEH